MAPKAAKSSFNSGHTAGIYADMTVDGPEIGTLVVVVDRAKNLPNRKSMGKQDPYCAARLGKEAKKTETDKRGGQTPRWDQELRFTVHESPDYYTLKVSVFNDDKKTELIGETRVGLEDVIIPGGGKNDKWHNLHCKGKYAGDIRIELTYYDTRPKEEKIEQRQQETLTNSHHDQARDGVGGPRELTPVKRRPLPPDPTNMLRPSMPEHSHSSPLPLTPRSTDPYAASPQEQGSQTEGSYAVEETPPSGSQYDRIHYRVDQSSPTLRGSYDPRSTNGNAGADIDQSQYHVDDRYPPQSRTMQMPSNHPYPMEDEPLSYALPPNEIQNLNVQKGHVAHGYDQQRASLPILPSYHQRQSLPEQPAQDLYNDDYSRPQPSLPHGNSMPDVRGLPAARPSYNHAGYSADPREGTSDWSFEPNHTSNDLSAGLAASEYNDTDGAPPPPPAHRTNGIRSSPQLNGRAYESHSSVPSTAPLNIRKERCSFSNSPLSQVQNNDAHPSYEASISPSHPSGFSQLPSPAPFRSSNAWHDRMQFPGSVSPSRDYQLPPSLTAGYEPSMVQEAPRMIQRRRDPVYGDSAQEFIPRQQSVPIYDARPRQHHASSISTESPLQSVEHLQNRRPHRASAPIIKPGAASPDPRTPMRKSVSPQPESARNERQASAVPFGPDSYEAFNPYMSATDSSVNFPGAKYTTPEQAREASIQHEREQRLGDGPIIGNDGRVIDPSDHLPTETWAPEPEQKPPKKTAQVNIKFRHSPQGAQPMPPSSRRQAFDTTAYPAPRALTISTSTPSPMYSHPHSHSHPSPEHISPTANARARLQKKTRVGPAQPNSSPIVPTVNTALQNPVLRSTASEYPLKEHENYGYGDVYGHNGGAPPPVPSKVPVMAMGQEDWGSGNDALSEELRRIDIG
ncbi:MAG: hypothetical protein Q9190_006274, partial [Brigantiaea leucoxantha]